MKLWHLTVARGLAQAPHWAACGPLNALAWLAYRLPSARRDVAAINLKACFPDLDLTARQALLRRNLLATAWGLRDSAAAYWWSRNRVLRHVHIEGLEHIREVRRKGRAALLMTGHAPPIELGARALCEALEGWPHLFARRHNDARVEAVFSARRKRYCAGIVDKKNMRAALRLLKSGGAMIYAPDQNFSYHCVFAPFFGVPAATVTATGELARRTGATVIPWWIVRSGRGYQLTVDPPLDGFPGGTAEATAARVNQWLESAIERAPAQYLWTHRRFRNRPPGAPALYPPRVLRRKHRTDL